MQVEKIWLDGLMIDRRMREVDTEKVAALAKSMEAIGLRQPISVWADGDDGVHLVAGLHRVRAAEKLGWETIDAIVVELDDIDRRRWEIAENLHRAELTALEHDQHIAEWERLGVEADQLRKKSANESKRADGKGHRQRGGTREVARQLGVDEKEVRNARKVAGLSDEAKETAKEVGLDDNRSALLKAAAAPPEKQSEVLRNIAEEKAKPKSEADPQWTAEDEASYSELLDAWVAATPAARKQFIREHGRRAA